jgi:hypothetical protein
VSLLRVAIIIFPHGGMHHQAQLLAAKNCRQTQPLAFGDK